MIYFVFFLLLCLLLSLLANLRLIRDARRIFTWFRAAQLETVVADQLPTPDNSNMPIFCFYGDSRSVNWPLPKLDGFTLLNHGVNGEMSNQTVARLPNTLNHKPAVLLVQIGINDLSAIAYLPAQRANIIENLQQNMQKVVTEVNKTDTKLILTTVFPFGSPNKTDKIYGGKADNAAVAQVNKFIHTLASDSVHIFDAAQPLSDQQGNLKSAYTYDLLHITQSGYHALNEDLEKWVALSEAWRVGSD